MAEMLERQPPDVRRLLLRTSLLDTVNGELADVLTDGSGADKVLLELEQAGAFVVSMNADRTSFRYHQMFAGLLRLELRRTEADRIPALHRLAARWFADHARPADAVRHLQAAGDWAEAARYLEIARSAGRYPMVVTNPAPVADILDVVRSGTAAPPSETPVEALSPGELRVLRYLPTNLTRPEIARDC